MEITTTMEASSGVCQTAVTTRQQLIKLPDTKTWANGEQAAKRGGKMSVKWVISLCTSATFAFHPLQSSESFWGALLGADWQAVQEAVSPAALSAEGTYLNMACRVGQIFFILEISLCYRCGSEIIQYHSVWTGQNPIVVLKFFRSVL